MSDIDPSSESSFSSSSAESESTSSAPSAPAESPTVVEPSSGMVVVTYPSINLPPIIPSSLPFDTTAETSVPPESIAPPVDNDHVAEGCEKFESVDTGHGTPSPKPEAPAHLELRAVLIEEKKRIEALLAQDGPLIVEVAAKTLLAKYLPFLTGLL